MGENKQYICRANINYVHCHIHHDCEHGCLDCGNYQEVIETEEEINGELYFNPYGKEELVSSYFKNDINLIK